MKIIHQLKKKQSPEQIFGQKWITLKMTTSGREPVGACTKGLGQALLAAALISEMIGIGHAFLMPVGLSVLPRVHHKNHQSCDNQNSSGIGNNNKSINPLFAAPYYNDDNQWDEYQWHENQWHENQWVADEVEPVYEQQPDRRTDQGNYEATQQAILGGAALGTVMAINNAFGMSASAETTTVTTPVSTGGISQESIKSYSSSLKTQPDVSLPYLEEQIEAAEQAFADRSVFYESSVSTPTSSIMTSSSETTAAFSPSFVKYTQDHMPGWIETGHKVYDKASPKIVAGAKKIASGVNKIVTPAIVAAEHEILGDANSAVLDRVVADVASGGKMVAGMLGKVITYGIKGGIQVAKTTPEVIKTGRHVYDTLDKKIIPEVRDTTKKMKSIADKTVPEVMATSKHAYDTIMPEVVSAEKQVAKVAKSGVDFAMPTIKKKILPGLNKIEHDILGAKTASMVDKTVADVAKQGQDAYKTVEKTVPQILASGQNTIDNVAYTGRTVAKAVPVAIKQGKQTYNMVDRSVTKAIETTKDIAGDLGTFILI